METKNKLICLLVESMSGFVMGWAVPARCFHLESAKSGQCCQVSRLFQYGAGRQNQAGQAKKMRAMQEQAAKDEATYQGEGLLQGKTPEEML